VLFLVIASCAPKEEEKKAEEEKAAVKVEKEAAEKVVKEEVVAPAPEVPKYGGTLNLVAASEYWDLLALGKGLPHMLAFNRLWDGDWAKGPAGGYGTNECRWDDMTNLFYLKTGFLAESWRFEVDSKAGTVTTIFKIRQGVHYAQTGTEAGRLVNGREVTADDVAYNLTLFNNDINTMNYRFFSYLIKGIEAKKTGPWEVSITHPISEHLSNIMRIVDNNLIFPPELYKKYGTDMSNWKNSVGTGPYIITDSVPSNMTTLERNPNYYFKDPVGPGKGNQLPYIEKVKVAVIPDLSTQQAALRTGAIDQLGGFTLTDKDTMLRQVPKLKVAQIGGGFISPAYMRVDRPPFDNIKVRRAMMMAINLDEINKSLYAGLGTYPTWPYYYTGAYKDLYLSLDDPACPDSVKELFTYNPEKAKQLLKEAGYPNGFKTQITLTSAYVDYYTIIQEYLKKVGVTMEFRIVVDYAALMGVAQQRDYEMIAPGVSPPATYPEQYQYTGTSYINGAILNDPYVNEMAQKARVLAVTDQRAAMKVTKELQPYLQDLALCLQTIRWPLYTLWWPWLKNYSGESNVGYFSMGLWVPYVWIDQGLKKSMGY